MKNPITEARKQLGLSVKDLSLVSGITEQTARWNERGDNIFITSKLLDFLTKQAGFDKAQLEKDYASFREWRKAQLLKQIKERKAN